MFIIYIVLCILIFPCVLIVRRTDENKQLFDKNDTAAIRGVSALFVMIAHYSIWFNQNSEIPINRIVMIPLEQLGGIGVLLFFFVSGYGINESYGKKASMNGFISKRFFSVYLPYVLMKILTNTLLFVVIGFPPFVKCVIGYLQILLIPDWFILVIILQYLSYYVSQKYFYKLDLAFLIFVDIVMTVVFVALNKPIGWFNALWLFTFGTIFSKHQELFLSKIRRKTYQILVISLLGFMFFGWLFATHKGQAWANVAKPIAGVLLCVSLCCIFRKIQLSNKVIIWFGKCSMYIYIVHIAVWDALYHFSNNMMIVFCCSVIVSIPMSVVIFLIVSYLVKLIKDSVYRKNAT